MEIPKEKARPKAPLVNDSALSRESWKLFQVIAEFVEGYEKLVHTKPSVSIFGSSRTKSGETNYLFAESLGRKLSDAGYSVVTGGGPGSMEAVNKGAYQGPSFSIGLNIELPTREPSNHYQDISLRFRHFFTRKVMFVKYAVAYVVLPGGYGTLNEFAEVLALIQTNKTRRIPIILVNEPFWRPLLQWFKNTLLAENMIDESDLHFWTFADSPEEVIQIIQAFYKDKGMITTET
jgi:uncharacterized protein (TIGR00730 family)